MSKPDKIFTWDVSARLAGEKALEERRKQEREQAKFVETELNATKKIISGIDELKAIGKTNDQIIESVKEYLKEVENGASDEA